MTTSTTTTPPETAEVGAETAVIIPALDGEWPMSRAMVERLQADFPELYVLGELVALRNHLRARPAELRRVVQLEESVGRWLKHAMKNPGIRAKRSTSTVVDTGARAGESALRRKQHELDVSFAGGAVR